MYLYLIRIIIFLPKNLRVPNGTSKNFSPAAGISYSQIQSVFFRLKNLYVGTRIFKMRYITDAERSEVKIFYHRVHRFAFLRYKADVGYISVRQFSSGVTHTHR